MTLIELLISIALSGLIVSALSFAVIVTLRTHDSSKGRANNARSEQNVEFFMPTDLASAEFDDPLPNAVACGSYVGDKGVTVTKPPCPSGFTFPGSNALLLSWTGSWTDASGKAQPTETDVTYRVVQVGTEFQLLRISCVSNGVQNADGSVTWGTASCSTNVVLHNLEAPPSGVDFVAGVTAPTWVLTVSEALAANADESNPGSTSTTVDPTLIKNSKRIVVTINGGGSGAGAGGGQDVISLSAGGTSRKTGLSTGDLSGAPSFTAARSRCGGNYAMIVDASTSITNTDWNLIKAGVQDFIDTFAGTPVKLEVIKFSDTAVGVGTSGSEWVHWFDMLSDSDVTALRSAVGSMSRGGSTNWEDAFLHLLKNKDGTTQSVLPTTTVFFTDGVPTYSRYDATSSTAPVVANPADGSLALSTGPGVYNQLGWNRAARVIQDRGSMNLLGVFVGPDTATSTWLTAGAGYHLVYQVGNTVQFQQATTATFQVNSNNTYQMATTGLTWEKFSSGSWSPVSSNTYLTNNTTPDESDNYRVRVTGTLGSWTSLSNKTQFLNSNTNNGSSDGFRSTGSTSGTWSTITTAQYAAANSTADSTDGFRATSYGGWTNVAQATYDANNTTADSSDGWRTTVSGTPTSWTDTTLAAYTASNTTADSTDGWQQLKSYSTPYTAYDATTPKSVVNYGLLGNILVGNVSGNPGGFVKATTDASGNFTNAAAADLFTMADYGKFTDLLKTIALGQCGGTVTIQTKVGGTTPAQDPFTYENTGDHTVVQTSAAYRSGTFDIALPNGTSQSVTILPQITSGLARYGPTSWSCKSAGASYPFTTVQVPGHAPWTGIKLDVNPNQAVSCVNSVTFT